jgi:hypothetical protein
MQEEECVEDKLLLLAKKSRLCWGSWKCICDQQCNMPRIVDGTVVLTGDGAEASLWFSWGWKLISEMIASCCSSNHQVSD